MTIQSVHILPKEKTNFLKVKLENPEITGKFLERFTSLALNSSDFQAFLKFSQKLIEATNTYKAIEVTSQSDSEKSFRLIPQDSFLRFVNTKGLNLQFTSANSFENFKVFSANLHAKIQPTSNFLRKSLVNNSFSYSVPLNMFNQKQFYMITLFNINRFNVNQFALGESLKGIAFARQNGSFYLYYKNSSERMDFESPDRLVLRVVTRPWNSRSFKIDMKLGFDHRQQMWRKLAIDHFSETYHEFKGNHFVFGNSFYARFSSNENLEVSNQRDYFRFREGKEFTNCISGNLTTFGLIKTFGKINGQFFVFNNLLTFFQSKIPRFENNFGVGISLYKNRNLALQMLCNLPMRSTKEGLVFKIKYQD